ncbi:MAG: GHMP kinase [Bacteroidia bacterium]|nr:GHMP kinase [Bacteroidia bacterium]
MKEKKAHCKGKLLLTGEYLVLDGATALAVPTKKGQSVSLSSLKDYKENDVPELFEKPSVDSPYLKEYSEPTLIWQSFDYKNNCWFEATYNLNYLSPKEYKDFKIALQVSRLLQSCRALNPAFLKEKTDCVIKTQLDFPNNWGLGSSSTLTAGIAEIANINALELHFGCFNGSGYDVAVSMEQKPVLYTLFEGKPIVEPVTFNPTYRKYLWFIHLGEKQNSTLEINKYRKRKHISASDIYHISDISNHVLKCQDLHEFEELIKEHESIIAKVLDRPNIKTLMFFDYPHAIKSLGAWGGDFILATGTEDDMDYFRSKGFDTILSYEEMVWGRFS